MRVAKISSKPIAVVIAVSLLLATAAKAQIVDPQNVLIRNVHLLEGGEATEGVLVSVLIRDNKLEIVSKDVLPDEEGISSIDARNGYLLGQLSVGETPSFIILNQNPTENFEVIMDTSFYTVFAVHNGQLVQNNLFEALEEEGNVVSGWQAYTPPPMALPSNYLDKTKWNRWDSKYISGIFLAALLLDRQNWESQDSNSESQVGNLDIYDGGEIRGLRFGVVGTLNFDKPWVYTIFAATNAFDKGFEVQQQDNVSFFDYRLDIPLFENANLSVGNQKEPISMQRIMSMIQLPMQERTAALDAMLPSRNFGVVVSGATSSQRVTWAGGVFNNWVNSHGSMGDNPTQTIGRVTWLPILSQDDSNLVHLGLGLRHSNAKKSVRYSTTPEFNKSPVFVDTDSIDADNSLQLNLEASWRRGPMWLAAEYMDTTVDSPTFGDLSFTGYHVSASWLLTGEMRTYNKKSGIFGAVPISRTVYQGGKGAWELGARWSSVDLSDGLIDGGDMDILSLGVNWWLSPVFNVNMNYRWVTLDRLGVVGDSSGFMTRVLLMLE